MTDQYAHGEPSRGELIREFDEVLDRVSRLLRQIAARELSETCGLSLLQVQALHSLRQSGSELEMSSLAGLTGLPASSVTSIVDRLVKLGLVERRQSDVDRRSVLARITPAGDDVMTRFNAWDIQLLERVLSQSDTEDIATCLRVFTAAEQQIRDTFEIRWPVARP
jgi:DNA-binding MarR family transcriptional regulator